MNEKQLVEKWRGENNCYATIDRNPSGQNKIIVAIWNHYIAREIEGDAVTEEQLYRALGELRKCIG